jgi:hypothetical protein
MSTTKSPWFCKGEEKKEDPNILLQHFFLTQKPNSLELFMARKVRKDKS